MKSERSSTLIPYFLQWKKKGIKSWLNQLSIGSKIAVGYILSLGITLGGATAGILMSNQYENHVQKLTEDIVEELKLVSDVKFNFMHIMMHQHAIVASLQDPEQFQHEYQEIKLYESLFNQSWSAFQESYEEAEVNERDDETELINLLKKEHEDDLLPYLESFNQLIKNLEIENQTVSELQEIQKNISTQLQGFHDDSEKISETLSQLNNVLALEAEETGEILNKTQFIHNVISFSSISLSILIAFLLSRYIVKKISIPIQDLTQFTHQVTEESNFNIQLPVNSQDEIGSLTQSFNHLIIQVNSLLEEQQKSAQAQLIQNEKLSSLGQMVAGIAHEINNPVSCISANINYLTEYTNHLLELIHTYQQEMSQPSEMIAEKVEAIELDYIEEDLPNLLQAIKVSAERTKEIATSLKNFSRLDEAKPKAINIHECLDSSILILKSRLKQGVNIQKNYGDVPPIEGYFSSLSQVFMNLINNAIDALIEQKKSNPIITITTENLDSERIVIRLADNGPGISHKNQQKIFESFFTTKAVNVGTGLGLAISRQIIEQKHHGSLKCQSQMGEGTEFWVILPKQQNSKMTQVAWVENQHRDLTVDLVAENSF
jgi:signal transduction histidine kinase